MTYQDYLGAVRTEVLPWLGGRSVQSRLGLRYRLDGPLPPERGWWQMQIRGRMAQLVHRPPEPPPVDGGMSALVVHGRRITEQYAARVAQAAAQHAPMEIATVLTLCPAVALLPAELATRVVAARVVHWGAASSGGYLFAEELLADVSSVQDAFEDGRDDFPGATPTMRAAVQLLRALRTAEDAAMAARERRRLSEQTGASVGRRVLARVDFAAAARAALQLSGADLLDAYAAGEGISAWIVRWRWQGLRLECTVDETLQILDSGICLVDHDTGESSDRVLTLESLPSVVAEAERTGQLHIWRRA